MAVAAGVTMHRDLFHVVFTVTLLSAAVQGGLLPWVAKRLDMVDDSQDVRKADTIEDLFNLVNERQA